MLEQIAKDIVAVLGEADVALTFLDPPEPVDVEPRLVDWFYASGKTTSAALNACLGEYLGKHGVTKIAARLGLDLDAAATLTERIDAWFQHHEIKTLRPFARPQELASTITELASQIRTTPEKFESLDVLLSRCRLLLQYLVFFYSAELPAFASIRAQCANCAEAVEDLPMEQLCSLLAAEKPVRSQPYRVLTRADLILVDDAARPLLARFPVLAAGDGGQERVAHARAVSDHALALLEGWRSAVIPKGAVVVDYRTAELAHEGTCYDEANRRVAIRDVRASMDKGDSVLLACRDEVEVNAPRLESLPKRESWTTPSRLTCGLAELPLPAAQRRIRNRVFMSYCHDDREWADRVRTYLKPLAEAKIIDLWDDTRIEFGEEWRDEIHQAVDTSSVAILLLTPDFLASDFIMRDELPMLLKARSRDGVKVMPLIVKQALFEVHPGLHQLQAANDPARPLQALSEAECNEALTAAARKISSYLQRGQRPA